ncbi:hypothetical protein [Nocardia sp. NBC_01499]
MESGLGPVVSWRTGSTAVVTNEVTAVAGSTKVSTRSSPIAAVKS